MKHGECRFMLDIETTGIQKELHDLLQIGILEIRWNEKFGLWVPGRTFEFTQHSSRQPESAFAKKHMVELYEKSNNADWISRSEVRKNIRSFFQSCGVGSQPYYREKVIISGWNVSDFDLPFLCYHGYLEAPGYVVKNGKDEEVGDYNYRIDEISGAIYFVAEQYGFDRDKLVKYIQDKIENGQDYFEMPEGKEHDALYDCYKQAKFKNVLLSFCRELKDGLHENLSEMVSS